MNVLVINCGSSSLKYQLIDSDTEAVLAKGLCERIGIDGRLVYQKAGNDKEITEASMPTHKEAIQMVLEALTNEKTGAIKSLAEVNAIGHRIVHGGEKFASSAVITDEMIKAVEECNDLAPLHNPANLIGIEACESLMPGTPQVVVFDTAFHQTMKEENFLYPVPYEWYKDYGVRKYGFHGTSHKYVSEKMISILGKEETKIITCHIGNGGSLAAVKNGKCIDTSMGFTPNAGIIMGSRSGDIDASLIPFVMKKTGMNISEIDNALNKKSGLLGISGVSSDSRDIEEGINNGNARCLLAQNMYVNKIVKYIAEYFVELGGCDALVFTAGVGENSISTRKQIIEKLSCLGIKLDDERNNVRGKLTLISSDDSTVPVYVIPTDEEVMIARDTYNLTK